ncbi:ABC transporter substrate-binding protein [Diplocloster hominis]|uniref:ABC transporter substrate-binding protein n=1 Tax=Diplocloster hominis TaxID=3079010 RepID=UPI0031BAD117
MRKTWKGLALVLALAMCLGGCGAKEASPEQTPDANAPQTQAPADKENNAAGGTKKDIKFYGKIVEYSSGEESCEKLEELMADQYNIESLQVDWGNLAQVIRTGVASNEPCDIYNYWPMYIRTFSDSDMCLDLTPYLDADGGAWRNTFDENMLSIGTVDGKTYAVPTTPNFACLIANKELFEEAGVALPEGTYWSWEDFQKACEGLKAKGIFPVSNPTDNQKGPWMWGNGLMSLAKDAGKLEAVANGEVECSDPVFEKALTNTKELYDKEYMYPGEGAVTLTTDESRAGFSQGKAAMCAEVAAGIGSVIESLPFEAVIVPWPSMGSENVVTGGSDGLFIPANVKDPDAAVEVLKTYTSPEVQQINADHGFVVSVKGTASDDPVVDKLSEFTFAVCTKEIKGLGPAMEEYYVNQSLAELVLGGGVSSVMDNLEEIRAQINAEK